MSLENKVALVTGAGRGIGRAITLELARQGADVSCVSYTAANVQATAEDVIKETGRRAIALPCDVANGTAVENAVKETLAQLGRIDILVNNAGITRDNLMMRMSDEDWDAVIDTNLKSVFLFTRAVCRTMLKQKSGRIVNITSVMGLVGNAGQANYAASKGGIIALTKSTARELGSRGVTANAIAPGFIETSMTEALKDEFREATIKQVPLSRLGSPEDVAHAVAFLSGDGASYITGQVLSVDGGLFM